MKSRLYVIFLTLIQLIIPFSIFGQNDSVYYVINKYVEASGLTKLKDINSVIVFGSITNNNHQYPFFTIQKQPYNFRTHLFINKLEAIHASYNDTAWAILPFTGDTNVILYKGRPLKSINSADAFCGIQEFLVINDSICNALKMRVIKKNDFELSFFRDTSLIIYYFDFKNFNLKKIKNFVTANDSVMVSETTFDNYITKDKFSYPQKISNSIGGIYKTEISIDSLKFVKPLNDSIFFPVPYQKVDAQAIWKQTP